MTDTVEDNESNSPCCQTLLDRNCRCWRRQFTPHLEEQLDSTATSGQGASFGNFLGLLETGLNPTGETVPSLIPRALYLLPGVAVFGSVSVLQTFLLTGALLLPNLIQANKHFFRIYYEPSNCPCSYSLACMVHLPNSWSDLWRAHWSPA